MSYSFAGLLCFVPGHHSHSGYLVHTPYHPCNAVQIVSTFVHVDLCMKCVIPYNIGYHRHSLYRAAYRPPTWPSCWQSMEFGSPVQPSSSLAPAANRRLTCRKAHRELHRRPSTSLHKQPCRGPPVIWACLMSHGTVRRACQGRPVVQVPILSHIAGKQSRHRTRICASLSGHTSGANVLI